jgi:hypothetical protein
MVEVRIQHEVPGILSRDLHGQQAGSVAGHRAKDQGIAVSARGRISASVVEQYEAATKGS